MRVKSARTRRIEELPIIVRDHEPVPVFEPRKRKPTRIIVAALALRPGQSFALSDDMFHSLRWAARYCRREHANRRYIVRDLRDGTCGIWRVK